MTAITASDPTGEYAFRDRPGAGSDHHLLLDHLAEMLDRFTRRRLDAAGVRAGTRCLEVGAGAGTVAYWLAGRVGPGGEVVATDLDPSRIPDHPRIAAVTHDITRDPLPRRRFDLIHVRLVLAHLPQRRQVLQTLVAALAPGGALVVEEFDASWDRCILHTPDPDAHRLFTAYHLALLQVLRSAGADPGWGRQLHHTLTQAGLVNVDTELWSRAWRGGEAGCLLPHTAAGQLHDRLVAAGMPTADLDRFRALLVDPRLVVHGNTAVSSTGHLPPSSG